MNFDIGEIGTPAQRETHPCGRLVARIQSVFTGFIDLIDEGDENEPAYHVYVCGRDGKYIRTEQAMDIPQELVEKMDRHMLDAAMASVVSKSVNEANSVVMGMAKILKGFGA